MQVDGSAHAGPNPWGITDVAGAPDWFRGVRPVPTTAAATDIRVSLGMPPGLRVRDPVLGVGGGDWTARLGWEPQPLDDPPDGLRHGLGLQAAACLAVSELLKVALVPLGMRALMLPGSGGDLIWRSSGVEPDRLPAGSRPGNRRSAADASSGYASCWLVPGSVGTSVAGALVFCPGLTGEAIAVDPEDFDPARNPFRYPALSGGETGAKATWAAALLQNAGWAAEPTTGDIGTWNAGQQSPGFDGIMVSSVDELTARFEVADVLAREVISAGVGGLAFHVQREQLGDGWACPYCEYVPAEPALTQAHVIAAQVGLPVERVIALQIPGAVLTAADLEVSAAAGKIPPRPRARLPGHRLADLVAGAYAEAAIAPPARSATPASPARWRSQRRRCRG